jgi:hypothetical protein
MDWENVYVSTVDELEECYFSLAVLPAPTLFENCHPAQHAVNELAVRFGDDIGDVPLALAATSTRSLRHPDQHQ